MLDSKILDVAIGVVVVYLLISLLCSAVTEGISRFLNLRAKFLVTGIERLLNDSDLAADVVGHPLVKSLQEPDPKGWMAMIFRCLSALFGGAKGQGKPSYMPATVFRAALFDGLIKAAPTAATAIVATNRSAWTTVDAIRTGIEAIADPVPGRSLTEQAAREAVRDSLRALLREAGDDLTKAEAAIEAWFDAAMDRVSGWYKRYLRWFVLATSLLLVVALNADSLTVGLTLWQDEALREEVVGIAQNLVATPTPASNTVRTPTPRSSATATATPSVTPTPAPYPPPQTLEQLRGGLSGIELLGWRNAPAGVKDPRDVPSDADGWLIKTLGMLVTVIAVQQGATFWFDLLKKLVNLRSSGSPPTAASSSLST